MPDLRIEPINEEIVRVEIEEDSDGSLKATIVWQRGGRNTAKLLEFDWGVQGTWARLLLSDGRQLCITQSGTMEPACYYIVGEEIPVPEEPAEVTA